MNILTHVAACTALLALLSVPVALASDSDALQLEIDPAADSPSRHPMRAWKAAMPMLPEGVRIRRIAFAGHGMFVFFSPAGSDSILGQFFSWRGQALEAEPSDPRPPEMCTAAGTPPEQVAPALERVLHSAEWQRHAARLDSLILECHRPELFWMLMPVPEGGYQQGVTIATYDVAFEPGDPPRIEIER